MKILKIWLLIISFTTLCFGANAQEMQKIFDSKKTLHEKLQKDFTNYSNMDEAKKQEYLKQLKQAIKYLIDNGANTKIKNKKNKKPYDVAVDGKIGDKELLG